MKPVMIIAIAVLFFIPINILAYEPSAWEIDKCKEWVDRGILYDNYNDCIADAIKDGEERERPRQMLYAGVGIVILIVAIIIVVGKVKSSRNPEPEPIEAEIVWTPPTRKGWKEAEKEQVRIRQDGKCAMCQNHPPRWEYDHIDGNRENNDLSNCQGLCPNCHSVKTHEGD